MTAWSYEEMNGSAAAVQIRGIDFTPDRPTAGKTMTALIRTTIPETVFDGASVEVLAKVGAIRLFSSRYDLFEKLKGDTTDGWTLSAAPGTAGEPLPQGEVDFTFSMDLPPHTPPSRLTVGVNVYDVDGGELLALKVASNP
ncbi:ML domain-containing protein [Streptomyces sp. NPDC054995]